MITIILFELKEHAAAAVAAESLKKMCLVIIKTNEGKMQINAECRLGQFMTNVLTSKLFLQKWGSEFKTGLVFRSWLLV